MTNEQMEKLEKSMPTFLRINLIDSLIEGLEIKAATANSAILLLSELKKDLENGKNQEVTITSIMGELYG